RNDDGLPRERKLALRQVEARFGFLCNRAVADVSDDADNRPKHLRIDDRVSDREARTQRVLAGQVSPDELAVHDRDRRGGPAIVGVEVAANENGDAHRLKEAWRDEALPRGLSVRRLERVALHEHEKRSVELAAQWKYRRRSHG